MPELPEVEVVRRGLQTWAIDREVLSVTVLDARSLRRHPGGSSDFAAHLSGMRMTTAMRRGKYLWLPLADRGEPTGTALTVHLGMSGQLLVSSREHEAQKHLKVRLELGPRDGVADLPGELRFVDQRIFGGMHISELVPADGRGAGGDVVADQGDFVPREVAHIARDPLDPAFSRAGLRSVLLRKNTEIKRALLDQSVVSGIGNIYADEALWDARVHYRKPASTLSRPQFERLIDAVQDVMNRALAAGGTSFDKLYVNVNGASGYFDRSLNAYGRAGEPCGRCGTLLRREPFMNRSSFFCPRCQRTR